MAQRRLMHDFQRIVDDPPAGISATPDEDNIMHWSAIIFGPEDTEWEGGVFTLSLDFTEEYPTKPPVVRFLCPMFHPNIYKDGNICLDILKGSWTPVYGVTAILTSIQSLLTDPNPSSPANSEASVLYLTNRREYERRVRETVEKVLQEIPDVSDDDE